jgi:hypothetical protein
MQQVEALCVQRGCCPAYAGEIAAGATEACDEAVFDRIATSFQYYRNRCCRRFGRQCWCAPAIGEDHVHLASNQIGGQHRQPVIVTLSISEFNCDIAAFAKASFVQTPDEG